MKNEAAAMAAAVEGLKGLTEHDWQVARSLMFRGWDWFLAREGRRWEARGFRVDFPSFRTKRDAYEFVVAAFRQAERGRHSVDRCLEINGTCEHGAQA